MKLFVLIVVTLLTVVSCRSELEDTFGPVLGGAIFFILRIIILYERDPESAKKGCLIMVIIAIIIFILFNIFT